MPEVSNQSSASTTTSISPSSSAQTPLLTSDGISGGTGMMINQHHVCFGCGLPIKDQFFYATLPDIKWHETCLKCAKCDCRLKENATCFVRNGKAYCKDDYAMLFPITKCNRCQLPIKRTDLVFKMPTSTTGAANSRVYHYECFACQICSRRFQPGDEYQVLDEYVYCKDDAQMVMSSSSSSMIGLTPFGTTSTTYQSNQQQTILPNQLYLNQLNMLAAANSSTISLTPENSIHSATSSSSSSSSSTASFSPNTNSSSSSIVDSPSNSSNSLYLTTGGGIGNANHNTYSSNTSFGSSSSSSTSYSGPTTTGNQVAFNQIQQPPVYSNITANFCDPTTTTTTATTLSSIKNEHHEDHHHNRRLVGRSNDRSDSDSASDDDQIDSDDDSDGAASDDEDPGAIVDSDDEETASSLNESVNSTGRQHKSMGATKKSSSNNQSTPNYKPTMNSANKSASTPLSRGMNGGGHFGNHHNHHHHHHLLQVKHHHHHHPKPARIRTVLNEKQLHTLRACYGANPRPDALMKEQLVEMTGLNPRVIRVWFQNKRCKDKKKNMLGVSPGGPGSQQSQQSSLTGTNQATTTNLHHQSGLTPLPPPPPPQQPQMMSPYNHMGYNHQHMMFDSTGGGCY